MILMLSRGHQDDVLCSGLASCRSGGLLVEARETQAQVTQNPPE